MQEKKLTNDTEMNVGMTDEEIVKDLEEYIRKGYTSTPAEVWLDLIRRLQYGYSSASKASEEWKAKYEAERKENETIKAELKKELAEHEEFTKQTKAEIERLTEELANERNAVITFQESANAHRLKVGKVMKQNAKLKKQVDELKEQKGFWEGMHDRVCGELEELQEEKSNTDLITQIYVLKNKLEQAVKDTAKEIEDKIQELLNTPFDGKTEKQEYQRKGMEEGLKMALEIVRESKGVEVKVE